MSVLCLHSSETFCTNNDVKTVPDLTGSEEITLSKESPIVTKISTDELALLAKLEEANR